MVKIHLGLEELYFDPYVKGGNSILNIHYPIQQEPKKPAQQLICDINLITLLMGAQGRGLQYKTTKEIGLMPAAEEDELVINVGDMLSRHTNNRLKSTIHRVVNPSIIMGQLTLLYPLYASNFEYESRCTSPFKYDENQKFENITAGEFLEERLEIGS